MQKKSEIVKKAVMGAANKVASTVGGKDLVDYASSKFAKRMVGKEVAKNVDDRTSGKAALASAGKVGVNTLAAVGAGRALSAIGKAGGAIGKAYQKRTAVSRMMKKLEKTRRRPLPNVDIR